MKKLYLLLFLLIIGTTVQAETWVNDTRELFAENNAIILTINMRTFGAVDKDGNGIIQERKGETRGNFTNAISRLDEISNLGVNTLHLLPINAVGTKKAYGTAGSLFAVQDLTELDTNLKSSDIDSLLNLEAKNFMQACHNRNIRVIVELPAYASYDMYIKKNRLFLKDRSNKPITLKDSKDLRVLNTGTKHTVNKEVYDMYEKYIDLLISLNVDGVMVQDPCTKSLKFWNSLMTYAKQRNKDFVFIAEMKNTQKKSPVKQTGFVKLKKLLNIGFDAYLGDFNNVSEWKTPKDIFTSVEKNNKYLNKFKTKKSSLGAFAMYNDLAPILIEDIYLSRMIIWLNSTLPINAIYTDGFQSGDDYNYELANMKAEYSMTDDKTYYVNRGKMDIYNYSRRPEGKYKELLKDFKAGNNFKNYMSAYLSNAKFVPLETNFENVFAYAMTDKTSQMTALVVGSFDFNNIRNVEIKLSGITKKTKLEVIKSYTEPQLEHGKIQTLIGPVGIQVFLLKDFALKN